MTIAWLKKITEDARGTYILMNEWLQYINGFTLIDINPAISWLLTSGADGQCNSSTPQILTAASAPFSGGMAGKYLVTYSAVNGQNNRISKIAAVIGTNKLQLVGGNYGANFTTELNVHYRVVDHTALESAAFTQQLVLQAPNPAGSTPNWQVLFQLNASPAQAIIVSTQPFGGWNPVTHSPTLGLTGYSHISDSTPKWWFGTDGTMIFGFTENNGATAATSLFYSGSAQAYQSQTIDPSPVVQLGDVPANFPITGIMVTSDGVTSVNCKAQRLIHEVGPTPVFTGLLPSNYDLRNDAMSMVIGSDTATHQEFARGALRNVVWCSDQIGYKKFVGNNRTLLVVGGNYAFQWNGDLVV